MNILQKIYRQNNKKGFTLAEMIVVIWLIWVWLYIYGMYFNTERGTDLQRVLRFTDFIVSNIATEKVNALIGRGYYSGWLNAWQGGFIRPEKSKVILNMAGSGSIEIWYTSGAVEVMTRKYVYPFLDDNKKFEIHWLELVSASGSSGYGTGYTISWVTLEIIGDTYSFTGVTSAVTIPSPYPQILRIHVGYKAYLRDIIYDRRTWRIDLIEVANP